MPSDSVSPAVSPDCVCPAAPRGPTFTSPPLPIDTPADTGSTASAGNPTAADLGACHLVSVATEAGVSYVPALLSGAVARAAPRDPGRRRPSGAAGFAEGSGNAAASMAIKLMKTTFWWPLQSNCMYSQCHRIATKWVSKVPTFWWHSAGASAHSPSTCRTPAEDATLKAQQCQMPWSLRCSREG